MEIDYMTLGMLLLLIGALIGTVAYGVGYHNAEYRYGCIIVGCDKNTGLPMYNCVD